MADSEFDVISKYFNTDFTRPDVSQGIGDDCAILAVPEGQRLVASVDTLIAGVHFPVDTSPEDIAYKAIAVNLSDLAAMGAEPAWFTLAISLPAIEHDWLEAFSKSFHQTLEGYGVQLVGGDTTRGELSITIQAMGFVDVDLCMQRGNAQAGDRIYVSGCLGDASLGLQLIQDETRSSSESDYFVERLNRPVPRVELGRSLSQYCSCAIDISDGLFADLGHILERSRRGAEIKLENIPVSSQMKDYLDHENKVSAIHEYMTGDDYELLFTVSEANEDAVKAIGEDLAMPLSCIGVITEGEGITFINNGKVVYMKSS